MVCTHNDISTHASDGPIFRGRYNAILEEVNSDNILQLSRYIHLNPVKADICKTPSLYKWSSYNSFVKPMKNSWWLTTIFILAHFPSMNKFIEYMNFFNLEELNQLFQTASAKPIYGTKDFKEMILESIARNDNELAPDLKKLEQLPSVDTILKNVASTTKVSINDLKMSKKGSLNLPRQIAIYLCRKHALLSYTKIAAIFGGLNIYGVRSELKRIDILIT